MKMIGLDLTKMPLKTHKDVEKMLKKQKIDFYTVHTPNVMPI